MDPIVTVPEVTSAPAATPEAAPAAPSQPAPSTPDPWDSYLPDVRKHTPDYVKEAIATRQQLENVDFESVLNERASEMARERIKSYLDSPDGQEYARRMLFRRNEEESMDPMEKRFRALEQKLEEYGGHGQQATEMARQAKMNADTLQIGNAMNFQLEQFLKEQPEARNFEPYLRRSIAEAASMTRPQQITPQWVGKLVRDRWAEMANHAGLYSKLHQTAGRAATGGNGGPVPMNKKPTDMTQEEATQAMVSLIMGAGGGN